MRKEWIEELIQRLLEGQKANQKDGVYAWMQIEAAYQSNKIEGNTLTRKHVERSYRMIIVFVWLILKKRLVIL